MLLYAHGMDKFTAAKKAGSMAALADMLGISRQAVSQWTAIPPLQLYRLKELRPWWFRKPRK
jgi:biotin operon repressor